MEAWRPYPRTVLDAPEFGRWQAAAGVAVEAAGREAAAGANQWACFLAEQAAQLAVKGLLRGIGAPGWGHDLVALGEHLEAALGEPLDPEVREALATLSQYYIPTRYPDATPSGDPGAHYTPRHAAAAVAHAERIRSFVADRWRRLVEAAGA